MFTLFFIYNLTTCCWLCRNPNLQRKLRFIYFLPLKIKLKLRRSNSRFIICSKIKFQVNKYFNFDYIIMIVYFSLDDTLTMFKYQVNEKTFCKNYIIELNISRTTWGISPDTSGISPLYYKQSIPSGKRKGEAKTSTCTRASDGKY